MKSEPGIAPIPRRNKAPSGRCIAEGKPIIDHPRMAAIKVEVERDLFMNHSILPGDASLVFTTTIPVRAAKDHEVAR